MINLTPGKLYTATSKFRDGGLVWRDKKENCQFSELSDRPFMFLSLEEDNDRSEHFTIKAIIFNKILYAFGVQETGWIFKEL